MVVSGYEVSTQNLRYPLSCSSIKDGGVICECKRKLCLFFSCTWCDTSGNMTQLNSLSHSTRHHNITLWSQQSCLQPKHGSLTQCPHATLFPHISHPRNQQCPNVRCIMTWLGPIKLVTAKYSSKQMQLEQGALRWWHTHLTSERVNQGSSVHSWDWLWNDARAVEGALDRTIWVWYGVDLHHSWQ